MDNGSTLHLDSKRTSSDNKGDVFHVESVLLHYTRAVGTYDQCP